jgi:hypothetical protein
MNRLRLLAALALVLSCTAGASAALLHFQTVLDGLQETPPVATPATGFGELFLDDTTGVFSIAGSYAGLIGTTTDAHIHGPAPPGTPAGVVVPLTFTFGVTAGPFSKDGVLTGPQMADLKANLYYVNIHSTFRPAGEIRGQLIIPEPGTIVLLGVGGFALAAVAWRRRRRTTSA